ncbi:hypothetical protein [Streptomyces sp. NPDC056663]|uniref:hypothetical protein n=1 Tax=Streptomyces sp. NPDC056663 TaxID=3345899 RepID=UPI0036843843
MNPTRSQGRAVPTTIRFTPVTNGIDFLRSVVGHLGKGANELRHEDLKYGVLHLHAATEVLLKARLTHEHWSQVLEDPSTAQLAKFRSGDFKSCSMEDALGRLDRVAGIQIDAGSRSAIKSLTKTRNALQHYGLEHPAEAVEANAGNVLNFLINFLDEHLLPHLPEDQRWDAEESMESVRYGLAAIQAFVKKRRKEIRDEVERHPDVTVQCHICRDPALVVGSPQARCRFCTTTMPGEAAAIYYVTDILKRPYRSVPEPPDAIFSQPAQPPVDKCPHCAHVALVTGTLTNAKPEGIDLCFHCAQANPPLSA